LGVVVCWGKSNNPEIWEEGNGRKKGRKGKKKAPGPGTWKSAKGKVIKRKKKPSVDKTAEAGGVSPI